MPPAIEIQSLSKSFRATHALTDVSVQVEPGEMVALIGASGSGKSTLLRHVSGFVTADCGTVRVHGDIVQRDGKLSPAIRDLRAGIGFVFQQFNLVGRLSVIDNVLTGTLHRARLWRSMLMRFPEADRRLALDALASVGMASAAWQRAATLSGGQQQRAAIARCLVQRANIVLADEPIASLDPESARNVMMLLRRLNTEHGCTVLVSLHQVEFAMRYCTRAVALNRGRVVYDGPSAGLTPTQLAELYGAAVHELFDTARGEDPARNLPPAATAGACA